jgi:hypothetical protein
MVQRLTWGLVAAAAIGCSASSEPVFESTGGRGPATSVSTGGVGGGTGGIDPSGPTTVGSGGSEPACDAPANPAGTSVVLAPAYEPHYEVYDLGQVPGVPDPLGGCVIKHDDPNTLLIAGGSESPLGGIYSIGVIREPCGHIIGFNGSAQAVATTPYVDANLIYTGADLMFYTQWPTYHLSQLLPSSSASDRDINLTSFGIETLSDSGPGGVGFVPTGAEAGGMRIVTWPGGRWYDVGLAADGNLYNVTGLTLKTQLPNNPGGFAYVPAGSPGFAEERIIVAEWTFNGPTYDRVATYATDAEGDPQVSTRQEFMVKFTRPWGAYFEPVTGDFLFLQWDPADPTPDRVFIVQGFLPPPKPPTPR